MEKQIGNKLPKFDSIRELARFWDEHDLMDFEDEFEEVTEALFLRDTEGTIHLDLPPEQLAQIKEMAQSRGTDSSSLIRAWISEKLTPA